MRVGSSPTLLCHAEGNPRPEIRWKAIGPHGQAVIVGQSEELVLTEMTLVDSGQYECVASNTIGNITASVNVIVEGRIITTRLSKNENEFLLGLVFWISSVWCHSMIV